MRAQVAVAILGMGLLGIEAYAPWVSKTFDALHPAIAVHAPLWSEYRLRPDLRVDWGEEVIYGAIVVAMAGSVYLRK